MGLIVLVPILTGVFQFIQSKMMFSTPAKTNEPKEKKKNGFIIFLQQFQGALIYILLIAGIISILLGEIIDSIIIFITVSINVLLGFVQEYKAQGALEKLKETMKLTAFVHSLHLYNKLKEFLIIKDWLYIF